jgi:branched-subunit amino acid ABC-type transport system permease component
VGQQVIHSLTLGCIYACLAAGCTIMCGAQRSLSLAYGGVYALGAYVAWWTMRAHQAIWVALGLAIPLCILLGICLVWSVRHAYAMSLSERSALLTGLGFLVCLEEVYRRGISPYHLKVVALASHQVRHLGPLMITDVHWLVFGCTFAVLIGIQGFLLTHRSGRALYAILVDDAGALWQEETGRLRLVACGLGAALVGMGGVLAALYVNDVHPAMGTYLTHKILGLVLIGILGNVRGALLMGFAWALLEGIILPATLVRIPSEAWLLLALTLASVLQVAPCHSEMWRGIRLGGSHDVPVSPLGAIHSPRARDEVQCGEDSARR